MKKLIYSSNSVLPDEPVSREDWEDLAGFYRPLKFEQTPEQLNKVKAYPVNLECTREGVKINDTNERLYVERIDSMKDEIKLYVTRYNEAEDFIEEIIRMGFWERITRLPKLCIKFLDKQNNKYKVF